MLEIRIEDSSSLVILFLHFYVLFSQFLSLSQKRLERLTLYLFELADALTKAHIEEKDGVENDSLQVALEASKKRVLQGSMDVLLVIYEML